MDVEDHGETIDSEDGGDLPYEEDADHAGKDYTFRGGMDRIHISKKAVSKYGTTDGCPACEIIKRRGYQPGRLGQHHSQECRARITRAHPGIIDIIHAAIRCAHLDFQ